MKKIVLLLLTLVMADSFVLNSFYREDVVCGKNNVILCQICQMTNLDLSNARIKKLAMFLYVSFFGIITS